MDDPKDIAFVFFGMAAGIVSGLGFYSLAILLTLTLSILVLLLDRFNYGASQVVEKILILQVPENQRYHDELIRVLSNNLVHHQLMSVETVNLGTMLQFEYRIKVKDGITERSLLDQVRAVNENCKVRIKFPLTKQPSY